MHLSKTRKATVSDIKNIHKLIASYSEKGIMLPRPLNELYENMRDFFISEETDKVAGFCALHPMWEDLGEIRSLVVIERFRKKGVGKQLIRKCLSEAQKLGLKKVFALTYVPEFFMKFGFQETNKSNLPHKIWGDCMRCPKFPECDEFAVIRKV